MERAGSRRARVLFISPSATLGGAERSLLDLVKGLPRDRFHPMVLLPRDGPMAEGARLAGAHVVVAAWPSGLLRLGRERTWSNRLRPILAPALSVPPALHMARLVDEAKIDLIHTNGTKAHLIAWPAAVIGRVPLVWHLRDVLAPGLLRAGLRFASRVIPDAVIANSQATAEAMTGGDDLASVQVIPNGLDLAEFAPGPRDEATRGEFGVPPEGFLIGALGALTPLKGHIHLIRAMPDILRSAPEARLVIVGEEMYDTAGHAGYRSVLAREIDRLGLAGKVILAGRREDVVRVYAALDVVVNCSVRPESFGRVLIEAMACERPVISTNLGGPLEILRSPDLGVLVPASDPAALARAVLDLHADPPRRRRMARAGRAEVMSRFTLRRHVDRVCALYGTLLSAFEGTRSTSVSRGGDR